MRRVRFLSIVIFVLALAYFGYYSISELMKMDDEGPVITMEETELYVSVTDGEEKLFEGITVTDDHDGDVTESLVVESMSGFIGDGERYVNYAAFDSMEHVSKESRKIIYTDYVPTRFSVDKALRFPTTSAANLDVLGYVHAQDCLDGDISDNISFSNGSTIDVDMPGEYHVKLEVTNSAGDTQILPVTITMYAAAEENARPQIQLTEYLVYTKTGQPLEPRDYLSFVTYRSTEYALTEGRGTFCVDTSEMEPEELAAFREEEPAISYDRFEIHDYIDYETPGVYEINYSLTDDSDNTGSVNLIVVVEEA